MPEEIAQAMQISNAENDEISSRTAFPSIPTTGITYSVKAVDPNNTSIFYAGEPSADFSSYTVAIPATETEKDYKIIVVVLHSDRVILSGESEEFSISTTNTVVSKNITLSPSPLGIDPGKIALDIDVTGTDITKCTFSLDDSTYEKNASGIITVAPFYNVSTDAYCSTFSFYDSSNNLLYSFTETINVFSNLTTNTWVQNGSEPWFVTTTDTSGRKTTVCRITSAMVDGFKLKDIYVDSTRSTNSEDANYTTESGTFINPCTSFSKAIERLTDATKDYTIIITGTLAGAQTIPSTISAKTLTVYGSSTPIKHFDQSAALTIPVTFKNIIFENGIAEESPGGAGINNQGNLTIDNCTIQSSDGDVFNGGGVFNNGTLKFLSGTISGNTAANGGGIYIDEDAELTMSGGTISGNEADSSSGGVHVGTNSFFTMTDGTISGNSAYEGGGVFIEDPGTFVMSGGTISGNTAISKGGAVYVEGTFKMKGSAYIPAGVDGETGSGKNDVYLPARTIKIAGKLTPPAASTDGIVATITPSSYIVGRQLIELDEGVTDTTLPEAAAHFAVTQPVDGTNLFFVSNEGKLATITPVLSFDNGEEDGTQTNPDNGKVYDVVKYSYLGDDNLKVSAVNPYEDSGFAIDLLVDGTSGDLTARTVDDGYHTLTIRVSKAGYASVDISKRVYVKIKPVKVKISTDIHIYGDTGGWEKHPCVRNTLYIDVDNPDDLYEGEKTCLSENNSGTGTAVGNSGMNYYRPTIADSNYVWLTAKSSTFYFYGDACYDYCIEMNLGVCEKGTESATRTLEALKSNKDFSTGNLYMSGNWNNYCLYTFSVSLDDSEDPPAP